MSQEHEYYQFVKKYSPHFLNRYENWAHGALARGSLFNHLQNFRAYIHLTNHMTILPGYRTKASIFYLGAFLCVVDIWGIWYSQEIYYKYSIQKWNHYQPWYHKDCFDDPEDYGKIDPTEEQKPFTRGNYSDRVKIVYDGKEDSDFGSWRRWRYR